MSRPLSRGETKGRNEYVRDVCGRLYGIQEETGCDDCGGPIYTGDTYYCVDDGRAYCSRSCFERSSDPPDDGPLDLEARSYAYGH